MEWFGVDVFPKVGRAIPVVIRTKSGEESAFWFRHNESENGGAFTSWNGTDESKLNWWIKIGDGNYNNVRDHEKIIAWAYREG